MQIVIWTPEEKEKNRKFVNALYEEHYADERRKGKKMMSIPIYADLERCKDFDKIDTILVNHGYSSEQEKYNYLINRMGVVSAQFSAGVADDDFETMYILARESYLLNHWRAEEQSKERKRKRQVSKPRKARE